MTLTSFSNEHSNRGVAAIMLRAALLVGLLTSIQLRVVSDTELERQIADPAAKALRRIKLH